jgi:hypothetical protein
MNKSACRINIEPLNMYYLSCDIINWFDCAWGIPTLIRAPQWLCFMYKKHLVHVRRLVQRYEPSSLYRTRGFIYRAGVGQNVMVTTLYLIMSLYLAIFAFLQILWEIRCTLQATRMSWSILQSSVNQDIRNWTCFEVCKTVAFCFRIE